MDYFKKVIVVCFLLTAVKITSAQTFPLRFAIKSGFNLSNAIVNDASGTDFKTGYHIGGTIEYTLTQKFLIQSGLIFSTKGSKVHQLNGSDYIPFPPNDTHTFSESYLIVPLLGACELNVISDFKITLGVGPYFGYGIGGKTKQKLNSGTWSDGITEIEWETYGDGVFDESRDWLHGTTLKRFDIGVGANIDFEYHKVVLGIAFEQGMRNIAVQDYHGDLKYKNSMFQVSIGYIL